MNSFIDKRAMSGLDPLATARETSARLRAAIFRIEREWTEIRLDGRCLYENTLEEVISHAIDEARKEETSK